LRIDERHEQRHDRTHIQLSDIQTHQHHQSSALQSIQLQTQRHSQQYLENTRRQEQHAGLQLHQLEEILHVVKELKQTQSILHEDELYHTGSGRLSPRITAPVGNQSSLRGAACHCPRQPRGFRYSEPRGITFQLGTTSKHLPGCSFYTPTQRSTKIAVKFVISRRGIRYLYEAAIRWSAGNISSHITGRNIVPDSPAFAAVRTLGTIFRNKSTIDVARHLIDTLELTLKCIARLFRDGRVGPFDVLENGDSLFQVSFDFIYLFVLQQ
jgi:hypothetical protein